MIASSTAAAGGLSAGLGIVWITHYNIREVHIHHKNERIHPNR